MGTCLSKKNTSASSPISHPNPPTENIKSDTQLEKKKPEEEVETVKKDVLIVKHRKSHDRKRDENIKVDVKNVEEIVQKGPIVISTAPAARTPSCTEEEVDAILIQCGRFSREDNSSSLQQSGGSRKYSGSKRSYDFDNDGNSGGADGEEIRHRQQNRQPSSGRRRTPSRERERDQAAQVQRSSSRERSGGGSRRVSRSPGRRRSESPMAANCNSRKIVSVPATVSSSSLPMEKINTNGGNVEPVKRIAAKRNASSPRARSPARVRGVNENQQPISLSRSNSRKAENSPYRRNPLGEIDTNVIPSQKTKPETKVIAAEESKGTNENHKQLTRSRSTRLSRDLDIDHQTLTNPTSSYTALLLQDIQKFHHKSGNNDAISLPPCVSKACSILEAVADLNKNSEKENLGDPFLESEVLANDDLMEPSFHKYVTVGRGTKGGEEFEDQESSGSNSFVGSQQNWVSCSNSVDSKLSCVNDSGKRMMSSKKRDSYDQQSGTARSRIGSREARAATLAISSLKPNRQSRHRQPHRTSTPLPRRPVKLATVIPVFVDPSSSTPYLDSVDMLPGHNGEDSANPLSYSVVDSTSPMTTNLPENLYSQI